MTKVEMNFAKYKKDERCRRLERSLKLSMLKRSGREVEREVEKSNANQSRNNSNAQNWSFSMFSESPKIEDKCMSSNDYKQRIMTTEKNRKYTSYEPKIASSNDKKSPKQDNCFNNNIQKVMTMEMNKYTSYEPINTTPNTKESPKQNNCFDNSDAILLGTYKYFGQSKRNSKNSPKDKSFMRFYNWKVILNQDCKLIIKGQLESGEIAWSKPIIRRLTAKSIQSICLHVYHLEGNIVDNENELPEYVRDKFYNGFPDDWENVYSLWQSFVFKNHRYSFHWPTKITDSDDDLNSEVTIQSIDIDENKCGESFNKICINDIDHTTKIKTNNNISNHETYVPSSKNIQFSNSPKKVHDNKIFNKENRQEHKNVENITQYLCVQKKRTLQDILKEDKINIIINNLLHKNCPKEYIIKILQMFNCLEDVFSYRIELNDPNKELEAVNDSGLYSSQLQSKETLRRSYVSEYQNISPIKKSVDHNNHDIINVHTISNTILQEQSRNSLQQTNKKDSEDFESQVYGTPKIVFEKVLENRRASLKQEKQRKRKAITNSISKDYIKSQKRMKIKDRPAHNSNFNDINIEDDIKYSVPDDRMKNVDKASKCNTLKQRKDIKQSKTISCTQGFVAYEQNLDDEVKLPRTSYNSSKHLNTAEIIKRSTKKPRIINTINGTDRY